MEYGNQGFKSFMDKSTTPFHAVLASEELLVSAGFEKLDVGSRWELSKGGRYYVVSNDTYICAFEIGSEFDVSEGCHIGASHCDSPCFRIKASPELKIDKYLCLDTEVYGGAQLDSWHDRPLSIAGRVVCRSSDVLRPDVVFVDFKRPVVMIADLAPHISDKTKVEAKVVSKMYPILAVSDGSEKENFFRVFLGEEIGKAPEDILDFELYVYNCASCSDWGSKGEFLASPRLDNLTSVYALISAITASENKKGINAAIAYDHEEIGNRSKSGANSNITEYIFKRIYKGLGYGEEEYMMAMSRSMIFSLDAAHSFNPMYPERYDKNNRCTLNQGLCIKQACSQSYATDSVMTGIVEQLCSKYDIQYQKFSNHSDIKGGGTIGSVISAMLPANAVDMGVPLLSMHSAMEMVGQKDENSLISLLSAFYNER
ncbi:MAG: M18 family aminopeptidase [Clostridiaceae bacterium]|nr:M18 family aminopeptidase [Clostridiaceae bacterium]